VDFDDRCPLTLTDLLSGSIFEQRLALEVAAKHPTARWGTIEIRPLWTN